MRVALSAMFNDASHVIREALERVHARSSKSTGVSATAPKIALKELV